MVANVFNTPIPTVLEMDWHEMLSFFCDAVNLRRDEALFQARLAGAKIK